MTDYLSSRLNGSQDEVNMTIFRLLRRCIITIISKIDLSYGYGIILHNFALKIVSVRVKFRKTTIGYYQVVSINVNM